MQRRALAVLVPFGLFACGGDDSVSSTDAAVDVAPIEAAADVATPIDASVVDAFDAAPIIGPVEVFVVDNQGPVSGAVVAFVEGDGKTTTLTTGATGKVTTSVPSGTSVTAAFVHTFNADQTLLLETVFDVAPNDHVLIGRRPRTTPYVDVLTSFGPAVGKVASYDLSFGCSHALAYANSGAKNSVSCLDVNGNVHAVVSALDDKKQVIAVASATHAPINGIANFVPGDFSWQATTDHVVTLGSTGSFGGGFAQVFYEFGNLGVFVPSSTNIDLSQQVNIHFARPTTASSDAECTYAYFSRPDSAGDQLFTNALSCAKAGNGDLAIASVLPEVSSLSLTTQSSGLPKVEWTLAAPIADAFGVVSTASGYAPLGNGSFRAIWSFVGPPTKASHAAPQMPQEITSLIPTSFTWSNRTVAVYEGASIAWPAFRQTPDETVTLVSNAYDRSNVNAPPHLAPFRSTSRFVPQ
jgi:hypothetical protein